VEAVTPAHPVRIGQVGLGQWGKKLLRNFAELADVTWLCDIDEEERAAAARRHPAARVTASFEDMLADDTLDAVVIATPVPTHYELARRALEANKHVFVEKPPAMRGAEMEELCELSEERARVLMPGHLLLYHPAVHTLKGIVDSGDLGDVLCIYGNRQNLGTIRTHENALWSLGVHDLSVLLFLIEEEPSEVWAHGHAFLNPRVEDIVFCYLRFPSGKIAHLHLSWLDPHKIRRITVVGRDKMAVFDDMEPERKVTVYDKAPEEPATRYGEWKTRTGDIYSPKVSTAEPLRLECEQFVGFVRGEGDARRAARDGVLVVRALEQAQASLETVLA
jgi:predicted dehydrogenase